jgi:arylformamidase
VYVYKQYDQPSLNWQYNNRLQTPAYLMHFERWEQRSRETETNYSYIKDISYGAHQRERLDIFPATQPHAKTLVFIHGGYWKSMIKESFRFIVEGFVRYGITIVLIEYPLIPGVAMKEIVSSCRAAIQWIRQNIAEHHGNPEEIYIAGHSAGAHLATMLMTGEEKNANSCKGVIALSGLFNLLPIQLSDLNDTLQLSAADVRQNSPVQLKPATQCPLLLAVGSEESNEFKDQSAELFNNWHTQVPVRLLEVPGQNHFSIVEALTDSQGVLHHQVREMLGV